MEEEERINQWNKVLKDGVPSIFGRVISFYFEEIIDLIELELFKPGFIYFLYNLNSDLIKIGQTKNWRLRKRSYKKDYYLLYMIYVPDCEKKEKRLHSHFANKRVGKKELFRLSYDDMISIISNFDLISPGFNYFKDAEAETLIFRFDQYSWNYHLEVKYRPHLLPRIEEN